MVKIPFAPGINRRSTRYSAEGGWWTCDKVRFRQGRAEKIGGWTKSSNIALLGYTRALHNWTSLEDANYVAAGTELKLYIEEGAIYYDVTPVRKTVNPMANNPFTTSAASTTVTVTDVGHGAVVNAYVIFSGAVGFDGVPAGDFNQEHRITSIIDGNTYTITVATSATAGIAGGGAAVIATYLLNPGLNDWVTGSGWGAGGWGGSGWGGGTSFSSENQLRVWSLDNFGEDLIATPRGGEIYYWDRSGGLSARAVAISTLTGASDTPVAVLYAFASQVDRHVIAFGVNPIGETDLDPMFIRWADQETAVDWTPRVTNTAGGQRLSVGSQIIAVARARQEWLVITDAGVTSMRYTATDEVYAFQAIAEGPSIVGPKAVATVDDYAIWMDRGNFYIYDGSVKTLECSVWDYVFDDINLQQSFKFFAGSNEDKSEIMFFYCSNGSTEIDRYVIYNYLEQTWAIGNMARWAWNEAPMRAYPMASGLDSSQYLYYHDYGYDADGVAMTAYIESAIFDIGDGSRFNFVTEALPDMKLTGVSPQVTMSLLRNDGPMATPTTASSSTITASTELVNVRVRGRQIAVRYESTGNGYTWEVGDLRLRMQIDGRR